MSFTPVLAVSLKLPLVVRMMVFRIGILGCNLAVSCGYIEGRAGDTAH